MERRKRIGGQTSELFGVRGIIMIMKIDWALKGVVDEEPWKERKGGKGGKREERSE